MDAERARAAIETAGQSLSPTQLTRFAAVARRRMRGKDGGFQRDHLRAFAKRVEVSEREVRIMGSKNTLLRVLAASNGVESATNGGEDGTFRRTSLNSAEWLIYGIHKPKRGW